jgi:hypothetical protein
MTYKKRDTNHAEMREAARQLGAVWVDLSGDPKIGADALVAFRGYLYIVECKSGLKDPLTESEAERMAELEQVGVKYHVWRSVGAMLGTLAATPGIPGDVRIVMQHEADKHERP